MPPASALQMYGSQEGGSIDEDTLSSILKTALGVAELTVTGLFRAIDQEEKGRITFGEWPGAGTSPVQGGGRTRSPRARRCWGPGRAERWPRSLGRGCGAGQGHARPWGLLPAESPLRTEQAAEVLGGWDLNPLGTQAS